ncbi:MAG: hypothetical protein M3510_09510 [Actinomycetota bacterium]|nr:hypothetical protein [Actinomycetota bacterium]
MSSTVSEATPTTTALTTRNRVGVVLAVLLGLADIGGLALLGATPAPGEEGPPDAVLIFAAVMGVITIVGAVYAWARRSRVGLRVAAAGRVLSAISSLPAFFVDGVPNGVVVLVAVGLVITLTTVALLVSRR